MQADIFLLPHAAYHAVSTLSVNENYFFTAAAVEARGMYRAGMVRL